MPRADEPRLAFRVSHADKAVIEAAALSAGVATGALVRECVVRYAARVAADLLSDEAARVRRRSAVVPVGSVAERSAVSDLGERIGELQPSVGPDRLGVGRSRADAFRAAEARRLAARRL